MKLFNIGCKGLDEKRTFDMKKEKYTKFVKLTEKEFEEICVMCAANAAI